MIAWRVLRSVAKEAQTHRLLKYANGGGYVWERSTVRYKLFTDAESASHSARSIRVICTSHVAQPLTSPHLIPPHTHTSLHLSLCHRKIRLCVCVCVLAHRSVCCSSVCEEEEEEEEAHRDRQMLKDKDVQLRSINCKAGEGVPCSDTHPHPHAHTHTHSCTTLGVNFTPTRVHVFLSEVFVSPPPWVSVHVSILNLNPYHDMHNVSHALTVIARVCSYTCCVKVMLGFCVNVCVFIVHYVCVCAVRSGSWSRLQPESPGRGCGYEEELKVGAVNEVSVNK